MSELKAGGIFGGAKANFANVIDGVYGTFATPAGPLKYIQTKAKLGYDGSHYSKLTRQLVPAREALNTQGMDFNQLLQRDLDDHRIAVKLIPYILDPPANALPGFFPPIVAVVLPFDHQQQPIERFDAPVRLPELDHQYGTEFQTVTHGQACRFQFLDKPDTPPWGVLRWNPELAKLVIMDGQHRAMALLAIERTVTKTWSSAGKGARYESFYREEIAGLLDKAEKNGTPINLNNIELPVTICWFPDEGQEPRPRPHKAARKLFVDVNNTAKPPSEARLVLLSDTELQNILARELLNKLRTEKEWEALFPLYAVEYDNPNSSATTPRRWSAVTNLDILKTAVVRAVFGPPKLITNARGKLQGKLPVQEMDRHMREQLQLDHVFLAEFHDGARKLFRQQLSNRVFPMHDEALHQKLLNQFYTRFGKAILLLLSKVEPYKAHIEALNGRYSAWTAVDSVQTLAKDALFEGVGMFWTLEDGHQLWQSKKEEAAEQKQPKPPQPDTSKAFLMLEVEQRNLFQADRAKTYLVDVKATDDAKRLYEGLITYAAQIGLVLAWISLWKCASTQKDPTSFAEAVVEGINKALVNGPVKSRDRRRVFLKTSDKEGFVPLNQLPKLEPNFATHYRYFWLELLLIPINREALEGVGVDWLKAQEFLSEARRCYYELLVSERIKHWMQDGTIQALPEKERSEKARERAVGDVGASQTAAQRYWFGLSQKDAMQTVRDGLADGLSSPVENGAAVDADADGGEEGGEESGAE